MMNVNIGWYIALTEPSREMTAAAGLVGRRFECYLPTLIKSVWHGRGKKRLVVKPLFPGYLFMPMEAGREDWERIRSVPGIRDFLKVAGRPATVPYRAIDAIKIKEAEQALPHKERGAFMKGQSVEVLKGPFAGFLGPIQRLDGKGRVQVMLDIFTRPTPVEVHESEIKMAEASS